MTQTGGCVSVWFCVCVLVMCVSTHTLMLLLFQDGDERQWKAAAPLGCSWLASSRIGGGPYCTFSPRGHFPALQRHHTVSLFSWSYKDKREPLDIISLAAPGFEMLSGCDMDSFNAFISHF